MTSRPAHAQAKILRLLESLRDKLGLSMLFITHDMRVAAQICDRIAVMKLGQIVEEATRTGAADQPAAPLHTNVDRLGAGPGG